MSRSMQCNTSNFGIWQLYEVLKCAKKVDRETLKYIEEMDEFEMREGLIEYLTSRNNSSNL